MYLHITETTGRVLIHPNYEGRDLRPTWMLHRFFLHYDFQRVVLHEFLVCRRRVTNTVRGDPYVRGTKPLRFVGISIQGVVQGTVVGVDFRVPVRCFRGLYTQQSERYYLGGR